jgi:acetyl-CoA carboxylase biotin carboxyl carrier protein
MKDDIMDVNLVRKLIKIVEKSDITEFSIQEGDLKVKISKNSNSSAVQMPVQTEIQSQSAPQSQPQPAPAQQEEKPKSEEPAKDENIYEVKSPIVGTFYRAPAPDADPYVQVGEKVSQGQVLCIVEAMKLMNEIESEVSGKIVKILVDNATPVEYNQPLFQIEKE